MLFVVSSGNLICPLFHTAWAVPFAGVNIVHLLAALRTSLCHKGHLLTDSLLCTFCCDFLLAAHGSSSCCRWTKRIYARIPGWPEPRIGKFYSRHTRCGSHQIVSYTSSTACYSFSCFPLRWLMEPIKPASFSIARHLYAVSIDRASPALHNHSPFHGSVASKNRNTIFSIVWSLEVIVLQFRAHSGQISVPPPLFHE